MKNDSSKAEWLAREIQSQKIWIREHGGDLAGYVARYGSQGCRTLRGGWRGNLCGRCRAAREAEVSWPALAATSSPPLHPCVTSSRWRAASSVCPRTHDRVEVPGRA